MLRVRSLTTGRGSDGGAAVSTRSELGERDETSRDSGRVSLLANSNGIGEDRIVKDVHDAGNSSTRRRVCWV